MYKISKEFSFAYGHRVYTQAVESSHTENHSTACKCRHIHGHEGLVKVFLESDILQNSMVTDFLNLGWLKNFLDDNLDHKFLIDSNDPMYNHLVIGAYEQLVGSKDMMHNVLRYNKIDATMPIGKTVNMEGLDMSAPAAEILSGYFIIEFVPTSENLAKWLFDIVADRMRPLGVKVSHVEWHETPKSCATYYG